MSYWNPEYWRPQSELASDTEVDHFELDHGICLPDDFKEFLRTISNCGYCRPEGVFEFVEGGRPSGSVLAEIFGVNPSLPELCLLQHGHCFCPEVFHRFLPIGMDSFGNFLGFRLEGPFCREILFWDHETDDIEGWDHTGAEEGFSFVAASFREFIEMLISNKDYCTDDASSQPNL